MNVLETIWHQQWSDLYIKDAMTVYLIDSLSYASHKRVHIFMGRGEENEYNMAKIIMNRLSFLWACRRLRPARHLLIASSCQPPASFARHWERLYGKHRASLVHSQFLISGSKCKHGWTCPFLCPCHTVVHLRYIQCEWVLTLFLVLLLVVSEPSARTGASINTLLISTWQIHVDLFSTVTLAHGIVTPLGFVKRGGPAFGNFCMWGTRHEWY